MTLCTISRMFRIWCTRGTREVQKSRTRGEPSAAYPLLVVVFDISGFFNRIVIA